MSTKSMLALGLSTLLGASAALAAPPVGAPLALSVQIAGAGASGASDTGYTNLSGGALRLTVASVAVGGDKFATTALPKREYEGVTLRAPITGATASTFDTDLSPNVTSVALGKLTVPALATAASGPSAAYRAGQPTFENVSFTLRRVPGDAAAVSWMQDAYDGKNVRKTITVRVRNRANAIVRTYTLLDCFPVSLSQYPLGQITLEVRPARIAVAGPTRLDLVRWYAAHVDGTDTRRTVTILGVDGGREAVRHVATDSFITSFVFPRLDATGAAPEPYEEVTFRPGNVERFFK